MPAYWIARARIHEPARYWNYASQVPGIIARYGARVLARGGDYDTVEGADTFSRFVVIEFPSLDSARRCFHSPEYQAARAHRLDGVGNAEITLVYGGEFSSPEGLAAAAR